MPWNSTEEFYPGSTITVKPSRAYVVMELISSMNSPEEANLGIGFTKLDPSGKKIAGTCTYLEQFYALFPKIPTKRLYIFSVTPGEYILETGYTRGEAHKPKVVSDWQGKPVSPKLTLKAGIINWAGSYKLKEAHQAKSSVILSDIIPENTNVGDLVKMTTRLPLENSIAYESPDKTRDIGRFLCTP